MANYNGAKKIRRYVGLRKRGRAYNGSVKNYQGSVSGNAPQDPIIVLGTYNYANDNTRDAFVIKRSDDSAETDISWNGRYPNEAEIDAFIAGNPTQDVSVVTNYNGGTAGVTFDATQSDPARQNKIIDNGVYNRVNGKVSIFSDDSVADSGYGFSNIIPHENATLFAVAKPQQIGLGETSRLFGNVDQKNFPGLAIQFQSFTKGLSRFEVSDRSATGYIDGVNTDEYTFGDHAVFMAIYQNNQTTTVLHQFMNRAPTINRPFGGDVQSFVYFDRVLTPEEIYLVENELRIGLIK